MPAKKLAMFVEGQTEFIFLRELLMQFAGALPLRIESFGLRGGKIFSLSARGFPAQDAKFQVMLFDCGSDGKVASAIRDRYAKLVSDGFKTVLGLRDLYGDGRKNADLDKFRSDLNATLPTGGVDARVIIAVMEIEAWFLKELNHFRRLDPKLDADFIRKNFNVDLEACDVCRIKHPAGLMDKFFKSVGAKYDKSKDVVEAVVSRLDFDKMYVSDREEVLELNELLTEFEYFLNAS